MNRLKQIFIVLLFAFVLYTLSPFVVLKIMFANFGDNHISSGIFHAIHSPVLNMLDIDNPYRAYFIKYTLEQCKKYNITCEGEIKEEG